MIPCICSDAVCDSYHDACAQMADQEADRAAAQAATMLAAELSDCHQGRLRTFLNPHGRDPDRHRWSPEQGPSARSQVTRT